MANLRCSNCGNPYPADSVPYRCPICGDLFDYANLPSFDQQKIDRNLPGMWQYRAFFELPIDAPLITLGEGSTPLVHDTVRGIEIAYKLESLNPTGSYKDRGTALLISRLAARGVTQAVEDSSGNAGASFAAYAARAHIRGRVFVPEAASGPKLQQIQAYGAELVTVPGPRSQAAAAVLQEVQSGIPYASHAYLPFGLPGIATIAYEVFEQLNGVPGSVIAPAGHGALLLGLVRGFAALQMAGLIDRVPYMVGVQAAACAPLAAAMEHGLEAMENVHEGQTLAEGVRVRYPARADALRREIGPGKGKILAIPEEKIMPAFRELARRGIYAEPTSALVWAALEQLAGQIPSPILLIVSGSGLKLGQHLS